MPCPGVLLRRVIPAGIRSVIVMALASLGPLFSIVIKKVTISPTFGLASRLESVLTVTRSATLFFVSVSVAVLLAGVGSVVPAGTFMVAVLTRFPVKFEGIVTTTV